MTRSNFQMAVPDRFNILRPLVGYGPESMFVAYSPFYTPALGLVERRNATPDRSHNETWDSIVNNGVLGLIAYLWLFCGVFYYGLKWMGLIDTRLKKRLFFGLFIFGGLAGGVIFSAWRGVEYLGVGIPFGIFLGLIAYIVLAVIIASRENSGHHFPTRGEKETAQFITLLVLIAGIVSHFVEINFGISIAVTKTYFWVYTGLLLVVGYILPRTGEYASASIALPKVIPDTVGMEKAVVSPNFNGVVLDPLAGDRAAAGSQSRPTETLRKNRRTDKGLVKGGQKGRTKTEKVAWREALVSAGLIAVMLATIGFDFITNSEKSQSGISILAHSFTSLPSGAASFGILLVLVVSWLAASLLYAIESSRFDWGNAVGSQRTLNHHVLMSVLVTLGSALLLSALYWLWHSSGLAGIAG